MEKGREQSELLLPPTPASYGVPVPFPFQDLPPPILILLPRRRRRRSAFSRCGSLLSGSTLLGLVFLLASLAAALFLLYPSDPQVSIAGLALQNIRISTSPAPAIDVSLALQLAIRNPDFFSLDYRSLDVAVDYRGRRLGVVKAGGGHVRARGVSYVPAQVRLDGIRVLNEVVYLIQDLARGFIPFDTLTQVQGHLHLLFLDIPIQGRFSCSVHINPGNQTVVRQDCYPE